MDIDILQCMSQGEGQTLEFLPSAAPPHMIAKVICAFANSSGGTILIGVDDSSNIGGVTPENAMASITKSFEMLSSSDCASFNIQRARLTLNVGVITVVYSEEIVFCDSGAYIRRDDKIIAMPHGEIYSRTEGSSKFLDRLSETLEKQTRIIESLQNTTSGLSEHLVEGSSFKARAKDHLMGL